MIIKVILPVFLVIAWAAVAASRSDVSAITAADLDVPNCVEIPPNGVSDKYRVEPRTIAAFLRLQGAAPPHTAWRTGEGTGDRQHIRIAFRRPVAIGSIAAVTRGRFSVLHPDAAAPGDVTR